MNTENEIELDADDDERVRFLSFLGSSALIKSCLDPFDYAMKLKTGEVIRYHFAKVLNSEWLELDIKNAADQPDENAVPYLADRGMDVRISEIVWVMDAPNGS